MRKYLMLVACLIAFLCIGSVCYASGFSVEEVSEGNGVLDAGIKCIDITFSEDINPETVADGITFTYADGSRIKGGAYAYAGDAANKAKVVFGRLGIGNYQLNINDNLKSISGSSCNAIYEYNVISEKDLPAFSMDFSLWTDGNLENSSLGIGTIEKCGFVDTEVDLDGGLIIRPTSTGSATTDYVRLDTIKDTSNKDMIFRLKIKADSKTCSGDGHRQISFAASKNASQSAGGIVGVISMDYYGNLKRATGTGAWKYNEVSSNVNRDENGYYNLKFKFCKEVVENQNCWSVYVYDECNQDNEIHYIKWKAGDGSKFPTGMYGVLLGGYRNRASISANDDMAITVKDPILEADSQSIVLRPIYNSADNSRPDEDTISVVYDEDLDEAVFSKENVSLMTGETNIDADVEFNPDERTLMIKPKNYLDYEKNYTIKVNDSKVMESEFATASRSLKITDLSYDNGNLSVTIKGEPENAVTIFVMLYSEDGKLIDVLSENLTTVTTEVNGIASAAKKAKIYVWEQTDTYTRAVADSLSTDLN